MCCYSDVNVVVILTSTVISAVCVVCGLHEQYLHEYTTDLVVTWQQMSLIV